jgi:hypothetical protein
MSVHQKIAALAQVLSALFAPAASIESVPVVAPAPAVALPDSGSDEPEKKKKKRRYRKPKPDPATLPDFACVTHDTAAAIVSLSPATLKRLVAEGTGPPRVKVSERRRAYRISDLKAWATTRPAA